VHKHRLKSYFWIHLYKKYFLAFQASAMFEDGCLFFDDLENFLSTDLSTKLPPYKPKNLENFTFDEKRVKTLVCHDMKGGYLEQDK
jgi:hypothetical protein